MRTFAFILAACTAVHCVQAGQSNGPYFPADPETLGSECSWIKECNRRPPSGCEKYSFHERSCSCLAPAAKCMYEYWKGFSTSQREAMYDRCGQTQFPFGVHMHYLQQNDCNFAKTAQEELDRQRETELLSYSCGWTLATGFHQDTKTTYEHAYYCLRAPGWPKYESPKSINYTELVIKKDGAEQVSMFLEPHENAGIDYHFYSADNSASKSGKVEPGDRVGACANALYPELRPGTYDNSLQYLQPRTTDNAEGLKWVMYFKNRNWIHKAHVELSFGSQCFNGRDSKGDYSLCTNQVVNWGLLDGSTNTEYAINGCEMRCNGGFSSTPCCISTGKPPSFTTGCGTNCDDCKNGCP